VLPTRRAPAYSPANALTQQQGLRHLHAAVGATTWTLDTTPVFGTFTNLRPPCADPTSPRDLSAYLVRALGLNSQQLVHVDCISSHVFAVLHPGAVPLVQSAIDRGVFRKGMFVAYASRPAQS